MDPRFTEPARCLPYRIDDYVDGDPVPSGYIRRDQIRHKLAIAGGATFGGLWLVTIALGATSLEDASGDKAGEKHAPLFVPTVGPLIAAATLDPDSIFVGMLIIDGLGQTAGLAMMIAGLATETPYLVRTGDLELDITPIGGRDVQGMGLRGRF